MLIKAGVDISKLNREIRRTLTHLATLYKKYGGELTITSTYEGNHSAGSLHYCNDAYDFRYIFPYKNFDEEMFLNTIGKGFDVVLETDHIHIEYDPK